MFRARNRQDAGRRGFTLIEIAFSLALVAGAVVTLLALFPMGIRTQQQARYKILAATKAMEMLEWFRDGTSGGNITDGNDLDKEGIMPWDSLMTYRSFAPDLECAIMNLRGGFKPLPNDIAYRLDSDNDEIRSILDQGGYVFYCTPSHLNGHYDGNPANFDKNWMTENRKLIIGVVGLPQQNAILYHPSVKVGPYQDWYPSPPTYANEIQRRRPNRNADVTDPPYPFAPWNNPNVQPVNRERPTFISLDALCRDPRITPVMLWQNVEADGKTPKTNPPGLFGYKPYLDAVGVDVVATSKIRNDARRRAASCYVIAALWYANRVGMNTDLFTLTSKAGFDLFLQNKVATPELGYTVLGMRYLAHAAACLTAQFDTADLIAGIDLRDFLRKDSGANFNTPAGIPEMEVTGHPPFSPAGKVTLDLIKAWHEASLRLAVFYANEVGPYDWLAPRPLNRQVMMDHPLCQLDLWSQPITADIPAVAGGTTRQRQWRACYPQAISHPGVPFSFPGRIRDTYIKGRENEKAKDGIIDLRDDFTQNHPDYVNLPIPYWPRILDCGPGGIQATEIAIPLPQTGSDGVLDENDRPVPAGPNPLPADPAKGVFTSVPANWQPAVGPKSNFNLTIPFDPNERCRQIVVWSVDWQSYEDFETAPSAPLDASRYPAMAPQPSRLRNENHWTSAWIQWNPAIRQGEVAYRGGVIYSECIRNPEHILLFREPSLMNVAGSSTAAKAQLVRRSDALLTVSNIDNFGGNPNADTTFSGGDTSTINECEPMTGQSPDILRLRDGTMNPMFVEQGALNKSVNRAIFLGRYGANRNAVAAPEQYSGVGYTKNGVVGAGGLSNRNGKARDVGDGSPLGDKSRYYSTGWVDGGNVPKSVHLRAAVVARFNYYDGRLQGALRN